MSHHRRGRIVAPARGVVLATAVAATLAACGEDELEPEPPDRPAAPASVVASRSALAVELTWVDRSDDETSFVVYRRAAGGDDPGAFDSIARVDAGATRFVDRTPQVDTPYEYGVAAANDFGRSEITRQDGAPVTIVIVTGACEGVEPTADDPDGDGLSTATELEGWIVRVDDDGLGTVVPRLVTSDPSLADSDGDGLCDQTENAIRTDPSRTDTDGDGLDDLAEVAEWGSSRSNVDSDSDARGNGAFFDGAEIERFGTSPALADSDGDGRSDFDEVNQNSTNPLVADIPQPRLRFVGEMDLGVNIILESGATQENAIDTSFEREVTETDSEASTVATTESIEQTETIGAEASAGYPASFGGSVSGELSQSQGFVLEESSSWTRETSERVNEAYSELSSRITTSNETIESGTIAMQLSIDNVGTRTFAMSDVVVTALKRDARAGTFSSIATLELPPAADNLVLGENRSAGPFRVEVDIPANVALGLLADPSGIVFRVASFNLEDRTGENFEFAIGETTASRTALLTLDFGGERPLETHRVATNVRRTELGAAAGVTLGDVLENILGLEPGSGFVVEPDPNGNQILTALRGVATEGNQADGSERFWVVIAGNEQPLPNVAPIAERILDPAVPFPEKRLMPRDRVYLAYVSDRDRDGLFTREENLVGTSDDLVDTDGDGLTDFEEVRTGWRVGGSLPFYAESNQVFPSPLYADLDGDGLTDPEERDLETDPRRRDTDSDGIDDGLDAFPTRGPLPGQRFVYGTSGTEEFIQIVARDDGGFVLLGVSNADIDDDGDAGGPFLLAADQFGAVTWIRQFETASRFPESFDLGADGTAYFAGQFGAQDPVIPTSGVYLLAISPTGDVTATNIEYDDLVSGEVFGMSSFVVLDDVALFYTLRSTRRFEARIHRVALDGSTVEAADVITDGRERGAYGFSRAPNRTAVITDWDAFDFFGACRVRRFGSDGVQTSADPCYERNGTQENPYRLALNSAGELYGLVYRNAVGQTSVRTGRGRWNLMRFDADGDAQWFRTAFDGNALLSGAIHADDLGRVSYATGNRWARIDPVTGADVATHTVRTTLGDAAIRGIAANRAGDVYVAGNATGPIEGAPPPVGATDLFVVRNPESLE